MAYKKLQKLAGANQKPIIQEPTSPAEGDTSLPGFLLKERKVPTPIPKRERAVPLSHS